MHHSHRAQKEVDTKLQRQLLEISTCTAKQTKKYIDGEIKTLINSQDIDLKEVEQTIKRLKDLVNSDDETIKIITQIANQNDIEISKMSKEMKEIYTSIKIINEFEDNFISIHSFELEINELKLIIKQNQKDLLQQSKKDLLLDTDSICNAVADIFASAN